MLESIEPTSSPAFTADRSSEPGVGDRVAFVKKHVAASLWDRTGTVIGHEPRRFCDVGPMFRVDVDGLGVIRMERFCVDRLQRT